MFDVRDFGVAGDGVTDETAALQAAIDACHVAGGGSVVVPAGLTVLAGPFQLKSYVTLVVEANAVIRALVDETLYTESAFKENRSEGSLWISARNAEDLGIRGEGVIDGQGTAFMLDEEKTHFNYKVVDGVDMRPHLLTLIDCRRVTIRDVTFRDSAYWCIHPLGCDDILISGIRILNSLKVRNCDGIDPDHSRNVRISDCYIESADDCICIKTRREYQEYGPTENVTVTGCTLLSRSCAIKIGSENVSGIRNIVISSIVINASNRALGIQNRDEGVVENVIYSDIIIKSRLFANVWWGKAEPISVTAFQREPDAVQRFPTHGQAAVAGPVRNIVFSNIIAKSENGAYVCCAPETDMGEIVFDNILFTIGKWTKYPPGRFDRRPCNVEEIIIEPPSGLILENVRDVTVRNLTIQWGEGRGSGGDSLIVRNCSNIRTENVENRVSAANPSGVIP